jgi:hypothetical protein
MVAHPPTKVQDLALEVTHATKQQLTATAHMQQQPCYPQVANLKDAA